MKAGFCFPLSLVTPKMRLVVESTNTFRFFDDFLFATYNVMSMEPFSFTLQSFELTNAFPIRIDYCNDVHFFLTTNLMLRNSSPYCAGFLNCCIDERQNQLLWDTLSYPVKDNQSESWLSHSCWQKFPKEL